MTSPALFLAFVAAVTVLMLIPGPNVALIVANSVTHGTRTGLLTMAGTVTATAAQLALVGLGLTAALDAFGVWFAWLRWAGVAYLVCLGIAHWRAPAVDLTLTPPDRKSPRAILARALLVSLTNPKTLLFFGAFFPQFIVAGAPVGPQVALLSATVLTMAVLVDGTWAVVAGRVRHLLAARGRLRNRMSGGVLVSAGAVLAVARHR